MFQASIGVLTRVSKTSLAFKGRELIITISTWFKHF